MMPQTSSVKQYFQSGLFPNQLMGDTSDQDRVIQHRNFSNSESFMYRISPIVGHTRLFASPNSDCRQVVSKFDEEITEYDCTLYTIAYLTADST